MVTLRHLKTVNDMYILIICQLGIIKISVVLTDLTSQVCNVVMIRTNVNLEHYNHKFIEKKSIIFE